MNRNLLKKLHWYCGIILLLAFLLTDIYIHFYHDHMQGMDDVIRMQYRSIHIYILFSSLLHIMLGVFVRFSMFDLYRAIQFLGSILLFAASIFLVIGIFSETAALDLKNILINCGLYISLAGTVFMVFPQFIRKNRNIT